MTFDRSMKLTTLVAACSISLDAQAKYFVLIPEGNFSGIDGRPFDAPCWILTPENGKQIVAELNSRQIDMVIDYEHATLFSKQTGTPAPAAGWLKQKGFTYIEGVGICSSDFEWTEEAANFVSSKKYKYISPVLLYTETTGVVTGLYNVALTNTPNLEQLQAKLAAAAQDFFTQNIDQQDSEMEELLKQIRYFLNLPLTTTAEEAVAELDKLKIILQTKTGVLIAENGQNIHDVLSKFDELKVAANSQSPDPAHFVPMAVYQEALTKANTLAVNSQEQEIERLIEAACSDGRLSGDVTVAWLKLEAKTRPDFVKSHITGLPKMAALTQQQTSTIDLNKGANGQKAQVDDLENQIAAQLGL